MALKIYKTFHIENVTTLNKIRLRTYKFSPPPKKLLNLSSGNLQPKTHTHAINLQGTIWKSTSHEICCFISSYFLNTSVVHVLVLFKQRCYAHYLDMNVVHTPSMSKITQYIFVWIIQTYE